MSSVYGLDVAVTEGINGLAGKSAVIDFLMIGVSRIGVPLLVAAVALQWWRKAHRAHIRHVLLAAGATFLLGLALNQFVLLFVHRVRPYEAGVTHLLITKSTDPSFPSDHATASVAIAAAFLLAGLRRVGFAFLTAAALVMFSRVYIGIHYFSDVVGGALTALVAALLVRSLYREGTRLDRAMVAIL